VPLGALTPSAQRSPRTYSTPKGGAVELGKYFCRGLSETFEKGTTMPTERNRGPDRLNYYIINSLENIT